MQLYYKVTPAQPFSCGFYEICKNTYFMEHLQTTAYVSHHRDIILAFVFSTLNNLRRHHLIAQPAFTCSKSRMQTLEECVKSVES